GSITKTFTATSLLWLVEQRKVSLDDLAQTYLGSCKADGVTLPTWPAAVAGLPPTPITLRDLGVYAPGLKPDSSGAWSGAMRTPSKLFSEICSKGETLMQCQPGTAYAYVDAGWELLGTALANRRRFDRYGKLLNKMLSAAHLSMPHTSVPTSAPADLAPGYLYSND